MTNVVVLIKFLFLGSRPEIRIRFRLKTSLGQFKFFSSHQVLFLQNSFSLVCHIVDLLLSKVLLLFTSYIELSCDGQLHILLFVDVYVRVKKHQLGHRGNIFGLGAKDTLLGSILALCSFGLLDDRVDVAHHVGVVLIQTQQKLGDVGNVFGRSCHEFLQVLRLVALASVVETLFKLDGAQFRHLNFLLDIRIFTGSSLDFLIKGHRFLRVVED